MADIKNIIADKVEEPQESWGRWGFKHVAGVGIGSVIGAGVGTGYAAYKGNSLKNGAVGGAFVGLVAAPGFGHMIYDATVGQLESKPKSFTEQINKERVQSQQSQKER